MRERQLETNTNKMILLAKRRSLDEDKGRLKVEIAISRVKIQQLQKKYHMLLTSLGQDEEGQPVSVTNFRIKYAQEKLMLQQEGDALDQKIKTAEKEIVAMENTLKMVNLTNIAFKKSLAPVKDEGRFLFKMLPNKWMFIHTISEIWQHAACIYIIFFLDKEVQEMNILEEELNKTNNALREYRKEFAKKKNELEGSFFCFSMKIYFYLKIFPLNDYFKALQNDAKERNDLKKLMKEHVSHLEDEFEVIQKQEMDKAEKLTRAECQVKRLLKKLGEKDMSKYNVGKYDFLFLSFNYIKFQRDFEIKLLKDGNRSVLQKLIEMCGLYPEMAPLINRYTSEHNLSLPEKKISWSTASTTSSSARFSLGSCSSKQITPTTRTTISQTSCEYNLKKVDLSLNI